MDKKTKNLLLLAGAGAAIYYFFFRDKSPKTTSTSSFSRVVGSGDGEKEDGCWYVYNYMGQMSEPEWKSPCPYGQSSSFSNASGTGCWYNFIDPDTGQSILQYRDPCPVSLPASPASMSKGGGKGGRKAKRLRFGSGQSF